MMAGSQLRRTHLAVAVGLKSNAKQTQTLAAGFFSCSRFCCSFHSGFYDNRSDTTCIYENHINFTGASGIPCKSIFSKSVDHKKQGAGLQSLTNRNRKAHFAPQVAGKGQRHTLRSSHFPPGPLASSPKAGPVLLTSQILFLFLKGKPERAKSHSLLSAVLFVRGALGSSCK